MTPHPPLPWSPFSHWRRLGITLPHGRVNTVVIRDFWGVFLISLMFSSIFRYKIIKNITPKLWFRSCHPATRQGGCEPSPVGEGGTAERSEETRDG